MQAVLATLTTTSGSGIRSITAMPPYRGALGDSADAYSQEAAVGPFRPFRAVSPEHASLFSGSLLIRAGSSLLYAQRSPDMERLVKATVCLVDGMVWGSGQLALERVIGAG